MKLDRNIITQSSLSGHQDNNFVEATIEERLSMVWPLTSEVASLSPRHDVEQRLQRHITVLLRRER
jgi:hypothetical protein